ncbi:MAG TPA: GTP 3',8-cyclase MoaA [Steroidobacteraceae bacterium]|nr:GTP 3',8-cyclase MoaA [Steroidobacteraceae bacterium]
MTESTDNVTRLADAAGHRDALGRPLHDLRISVMDRCNFRCPYCMPRETFHQNYRFLRSAERLSFDEIVRLTRLAVEIGVRKVRLTGGEPLLRPNLSELVGELSSLDGIDDVALTTNGVLLAKNAAELKANGLGRVTVSLDTLDDAVFRRMSGGFGRPQQVLEGIEAARTAGLAPIKVNAVVQRGVNDQGVLDLVRHFRGTNVIVRFIEYMDVGNSNHWNGDLVVPSQELVSRIDAHWPVEPVAGNYHGEVAERYAFRDGAGEIGFISSVTQPFCGACTRARLSSEGVLYTCLFATQGQDLRGPLRAGATDDELRRLLRDTWTRRIDRYSEQRAELRRSEKPLRKIEMYYIGG